MRASATTHGSALFRERERRRTRHTQRRRERRGTSRTKKRENSWEASCTLYSSCAIITVTAAANSGRCCVERAIHRPGHGALRPCRPCSPRPCSGCWSLKISAFGGMQTGAIQTLSDTDEQEVERESHDEKRREGERGHSQKRFWTRSTIPVEWRRKPLLKHPTTGLFA